MTSTARKTLENRTQAHAAKITGSVRRDERPPYLAALAVSAVVLFGYVWTLAPTVTFWDAGEFIAATKILGIPHPPGTPLFVLMSNVWAAIVGIGEYAFRTNLMTAIFSAAAAGFFFLLVAQVLARKGERQEPSDNVYRIGGAAAAAIVSAFVFTVWQNSNETEVYMVSAFSIAAIVWLGWLWRQHRGTARAPHILLIIVYLEAISLGVHLLTLLVGPALIVYLWHVIKTEPLDDERDRRIEWAQWTVVTGVWALLVGTGLGSTTLLTIGGVIFVIAGVYAASAGALRFALAVLLIGAFGASTYLFLFVRANLDPFINEADPSTWESLLAVIRREQYPTRLPWDNPIYPSGPNNPGRTVTLFWQQVVNYLQYFDWQWSNSLERGDSTFALPRLPFTILFTSLGIYGVHVLRRHDRSTFWLLLIIWLTTGLGLVGYMNFKPGYSLFWEQYPEGNMHEVRERDYFFTVSFQVWGLFVGIAIARLYRVIRAEFFQRENGAVKYVPAGVMGLALLPFFLNFSAASRSHGPEARLARDFAYDLLQSVEPYGIVFTNGDNDTFPLWYAQEVEEVRQDVALVNLSLGNTDWYIRQLRDNPVRPFDPQQAPWFAQPAQEAPPPPIHSWTDDEIAGLGPRALSRTYTFNVGRVSHTLQPGTPLYVKDVLILRLIQENWDRRPIYFSITAGSNNWVGLGRYLTQEALVLRLNVESEPDSSRLAPGFLGVPLDVPRTDSLAWNVYRYSRLFDVDTLKLDPTNRNIATNLSLPFISLGQAYELRGQQQRAFANYKKAYQLSRNPQLGQVLQMAPFDFPTIPFGDTPIVETVESLPR